MIPKGKVDFPSTSMGEKTPISQGTILNPMLVVREMGFSEWAHLEQEGRVWGSAGHQHYMTWVKEEHLGSFSKGSKRPGQTNTIAVTVSVREERNCEVSL